MAYRKILVGVDGSETSLRAATDAARLARLQGAELITLYVHGDDQGAGRAAALEAAADVARAEGIESTPRTERGDPADTLIRVAEAEGVDLIVVGNKGMTGVQRFMLGNVPNKVSHHAPCDLMIVRTT